MNCLALDTVQKAVQTPNCAKAKTAAIAEENTFAL